MNGPQLKDVDRGQVGIGTLIVFIALVLVAAVAAGVLINTAGQLQSRASDTGQDAQSQVSNQIDVVSATGKNTDGDSAIETVNLVVKKSPGSDPLNLSAATIQYTAPSASATITSSGANSTTFSTSPVSGTGNGDAVLDDTTERVKISIDLTQGSLGALSEGTRAELKIVDQSGATTTYGVNVPDVLTGSVTGL